MSVFANPRHADQQRMTATENRHQQLIDDFVLADDDFADLAFELAVGGAELFDHFDVVVGFGKHVGDSSVRKPARSVS